MILCFLSLCTSALSDTIMSDSSIYSIYSLRIFMVIGDENFTTEQTQQVASDCLKSPPSSPTTFHWIFQPHNLNTLVEADPPRSWLPGILLLRHVHLLCLCHVAGHICFNQCVANSFTLVCTPNWKQESSCVSSLTALLSMSLYLLFSCVLCAGRSTGAIICSWTVVQALETQGILTLIVHLGKPHFFDHLSAYLFLRLKINPFPPTFYNQ